MLPLLLSLIVHQASAAPTPPPAPEGNGGYTRMVTKADGTLEMQTAAQRLVADGKPIVWLIGAIHVGRKDYYAGLQRLLGYQDAVYYEGVRASATAPTIPNRPAPAAGAPRATYTVLSDALGLDFQMTDIDYRHEGWTNVDLTMEDLDRLNKAQSGGKPTQFDQIKGFLTPGSPMATQFASIMGMATPGMKEAIKLLMIRTAGSGDLPGIDPATQAIIIAARNHTVVDALAAAFSGPTPPRSIGVFYGAGHLGDVQKSLVAQYGYRLDEKRWFAAAQADPKKIDATGKMMLDAMEKALAAKGLPKG